MSATELERRVTDLLNRRAEEAMNTTNTEERLAELLAQTRAADRRHSRRTLTAAVVATAAATALVLWATTRGEDRAEPQPVAPVSPQQVATEYIEALAADDIPRAESYLSAEPVLKLWDERRTDLAGWRAAQAWNKAVEFEMDPGTCQEENATADSTTSTFRCPYVFEGLGSQELGLGPYGGSTYLITVEDGLVVATSDRFAYGTNGYSRQIWEPFTAWVTETYPQDVDVMYTDGGATQATTDESNRLWHQHLIQYIAARLAGR